MQKTRIGVDGHAIVCHEVEFRDMDHTLEWLLETAESYGCKEAVEHLQKAKYLISQSKESLF